MACIHASINTKPSLWSVLRVHGQAGRNCCTANSQAGDSRHALTSWSPSSMASSLLSHVPTTPPSALNAPSAVLTLCRDLAAFDGVPHVPRRTNRPGHDGTSDNGRPRPPSAEQRYTWVNGRGGSLGFIFSMCVVRAGIGADSFEFKFALRIQVLVVRVHVGIATAR